MGAKNRWTRKQVHLFRSATPRKCTWLAPLARSRSHLIFDKWTGEALPLIAAEKAERQKATQFKAGESPNPAGRRGKEQVNTKTYSPVPKRDAKKMNAASTPLAELQVK